MEKSDNRKIRKLRDRGLIDKLEDGSECVRVSARYPGKPTSRDRKAWASTLESWQQDVAKDVGTYGGQLVDKSLSLSGQSVEALVPIKDYDAVAEKLARNDVNIRIVEEYQVDSDV